MSDYKGQALKYKNNGEELKHLLDIVLDNTKEVEEMLKGSQKNVKDDYFTEKITEANKRVEEDANEINTKIGDISDKLYNEAERLDKIELEKERLTQKTGIQIDDEIIVDDE